MQFNDNKDKKWIGNRLGRWTPKLTDETRLYAIQRLACDVKPKKVAKEIQMKWGVKVTPTRLTQLRDCKKYFPIYSANRDKYLKTLVSVKTIDIAIKDKRLEQADKIGKKLIAFIDKLSERLDTDWDKSADMKGFVTMLQALRELARTYKDFLSYAKTETDMSPENVRKNDKSFLVGININNVDKTQKKPVIDVQAETQTKTGENK